jgi:dsDNA-binding SOS-regulon protein
MLGDAAFAAALRCSALNQLRCFRPPGRCRYRGDVAIKTAKVDIRRALAILELCPDLELDEQLKLSTLEGETELNEIVSMLLAENEDDEGMIGRSRRRSRSARNALPASSAH